MKIAQLIQMSKDADFSPGVLYREVDEMSSSEISCPVELLTFSVEPLVTSEAHAHPSTEIWHIVSGHGRVISQDGELEVKSGDLVLLQPDQLHQLENSSNEIMNALSISWISKT